MSGMADSGLSNVGRQTSGRRNHDDQAGHYRGRQAGQDLDR
jgi:hypothetical protein